jgi:membrane-bound ClpP family serine protease
MTRHTRILLTVGAALLVLGAVGAAVLGFNSWWLLPLILGGTATVMGLTLWLIERGKSGNQRRMLTILGWGSVIVGGAELVWGLFRIPATEVVVDVVFAVAAGASLLTLGVLCLRHARTMSEATSATRSDNPRT